MRRQVVQLVQQLLQHVPVACASICWVDICGKNHPVCFVLSVLFPHCCFHLPMTETPPVCFDAAMSSVVCFSFWLYHSHACYIQFIYAWHTPYTNNHPAYTIHQRPPCMLYKVSHHTSEPSVNASEETSSSCAFKVNTLQPWASMDTTPIGDPVSKSYLCGMGDPVSKSYLCEMEARWGEGGGRVGGGWV